jgi:hypothetical protein
MGSELTLAIEGAPVVLGWSGSRSGGAERRWAELAALGGPVRGLCRPPRGSTRARVPAKRHARLRGVRKEASQPASQPRRRAGCWTTQPARFLRALLRGGLPRTQPSAPRPAQL